MTMPEDETPDGWCGCARASAVRTASGLSQLQYWR